MAMPRSASRSSAASILIVSGASGAAGDLLVRTVLAQFPDHEVPVDVIPDVLDSDRVHQAVDQAAGAGSFIVHTLVVPELRVQLNLLARARGVTAIDAVGSLLEQLSSRLGVAPAGRPGLYRRLRARYFQRIEAVEFAVSHDDGLNPDGWHEADLVLVGVSRSGKTPLSMYLAMQGWKVANVPLVRGVQVPEPLLRLEARRLIGLMLNRDTLGEHRRWRAQHLGIPSAHSDYVDPVAIDQELRDAQRFFAQHGWVVVDATDKPIEETAQEVLHRLGLRSSGEAG